MSRQFLEALAKKYGGQYISPSDAILKPIESMASSAESYPTQYVNAKIGENTKSQIPIRAYSNEPVYSSAHVVVPNALPMPVSTSGSDSWTVQIQKWTWRSKKQTNANMNKLAGSETFSENFSQLLEKNEYIDVTDHNSDGKSIYLYACLCEYEATQKFYAGKYHVPVELRENFKTRCTFYMKEPGKVTWQLPDGSTHSGLWIEMLQDALNISWVDAVATLGEMVGIEFANMTELTSSQYVAETNGRKDLQNNIPRVLSSSFRPMGEAYVLERLNPIKGHSGQMISAIASYKCRDKIVYVPAIVADGKLSIGKHKPTAHFLNQDLLDKYPGTSVLFFANMKVALELQELLGKPKNGLPKFIITAHLGHNLGLLPWGYLYTHPIIFIPDTTKNSLARVKGYAKFCEEKHIDSFSVSKCFVVLGAMKVMSDDALDEFSEAEKHILANCIWLDEEEYLQTVITKLSQSTQSFEEFENLWKQLGVFKDSQQVIQASKCSALPLLPPELKPSKPKDFSELTALHVIRYGATIMLVGMKNAGKTQVSYILASAVLGKKNLPWPFCKNDYPDMGNVCIVDGETPSDELMENLAQHGLLPKLGKRLCLLSSMGGDNPDWFEGHSINEEEFRKALRDFLIENNCRLLILDNMKALMGSKIGQPDAVQKIMDWIRELQKLDICVAYILHKDEDAPATSKDKNKGSALFRELARVIINIYGQEEIERIEICPDEVFEVAKQDGLTCGISFPTCKTAPALQKLKIWLHLPLGAEEWQTICVSDTDGHKLVPPETDQTYMLDSVNDISPEHQGDVSTNLSSSSRLSNVSKEAEQVYLAIRDFPNSVCTIGKLEEKFIGSKGMGRDTIRDKYIVELINAELVERIGDKKRDTQYRAIVK